MHPESNWSGKTAQILVKAQEAFVPFHFDGELFTPGSMRQARRESRALKWVPVEIVASLSFPGVVWPLSQATLLTKWRLEQRLPHLLEVIWYNFSTVRLILFTTCSALLLLLLLSLVSGSREGEDLTNTISPLSRGIYGIASRFTTIHRLPNISSRYYAPWVLNSFARSRESDHLWRVGPIFMPDLTRSSENSHELCENEVKVQPSEEVRMMRNGYCLLA